MVLRAEKGKLRLMVDDEDGGKVQEVVYEVNPRKEKEEKDGKSGEGEGREVGGGGEKKAEGFRAYGAGEVPGGIVPLDGAKEAGRGLSGDGGGVGDLAAVAGSGDGRDTHGLAAPGPGGEGGGPEPPSCRIIGEEEPGGVDEGAGPEIEEATEKYQGAPGSAGGFNREKALATLKENPDGEGEKVGAGAGIHHPAGTQRGLDCDGGSGAVGGVAEDVLRVGGSGAESHGPGVGESCSREALSSSGCGEGGSPKESAGSGKKVVLSGEDDRGEGSTFGLRSSRG